MIKNNFWNKLKKRGKPILALAPMAGFTNSIFRRLCKKYGADVLYSEMASATALYYSSSVKSSLNRKDGAKATLELLKFKPSLEKYYVVQLFGSDPKHFAAAAKIITNKVKPDGIDINFGCPASKIVKQGAGADLMKDLPKSREIIKQVLANTHLPVSIKLRAGVGEVNVLKFLENIMDLPVAAVMIHGRTLKQGFAGKPDFDLIKKARQYFTGVILANGGINSLADAKEALMVSQADGLGLARGVLGRPWLFAEIKNNKISNLSMDDIFKIMWRQAFLFKKENGQRAILELRKHFVWYVQGLVGASRLREQLVKVSTLDDLKRIIKQY